MQPIIGSILPHIQPNIVYIVKRRKDNSTISVHRTEDSANEEASKKNLKALIKYLIPGDNFIEFHPHSQFRYTTPTDAAAFLRKYDYFTSMEPFEPPHEKRLEIIADYEKHMQEFFNQPTATFSYYCVVEAQELKS